jgi:ligand-binding SRPBCC domain-containing protein
MKHKRERAIAGVITGLINLNETVKWEGRHLGKKRILETRITAMNPYSFFCDEMVKGDFKSMKHEHHFKQVDNGTIMIDLFNFETPYSTFGRIINFLFLSRYLRKVLEQRNAVIREYAETNKWKHVL